MKVFRLCALLMFSGLASAQSGVKCVHVRDSLGKVQYACEREGRSDHIGWDEELGTLVFVKLGAESLSYGGEEAGVKPMRVIRTVKGFFLGFPPVHQIPYYWRSVPTSLPL